MSSFQFPSDPSDGDVLVRGDLQATYDSANNTWVVSQLQQVPGIEGAKGEKGDKGDPGSGVSVSGVVSTQSNLPAASIHQGEFWVTDDTNELYFSDGLTWSNLGPTFQGEDGEDGQGWTSVTPLTTTNSYRLQFNSDTPSLAFTTPNLKGDDAIAAVGVKDVAYARMEFVNTTDPTIADLAQHGSDSYDPWVASADKLITMPADADMALVWWQANSNFDIEETNIIEIQTNGAGYTNGSPVTFRCNLRHTLTVQNAEIISGKDPSYSSTRYCYHNWSGYYNEVAAGGRPSIDGRATNQAFTKLELIEFPKGGTDVTFKQYIDILDMSTGHIEAGDMALTVIAFDSAVSTGLVDALASSTIQAFSSDLPEIQASTPDDIKTLRAAELKNQINVALIEIGALLVENQGNQSVITDLNDIKTKLSNAKNLQGTYGQIFSAVATQIRRLNINYLDSTFYFQ